jgi:hypothetical protein
MGKAIEMRAHIPSQEKNNQEIKEEVDPIDRANNRQSVETTKEKGPREIEVGRTSKVFVDTVARAQSIRFRRQETKNEHGKWKQRREHEEHLFQLWEAWSLQQKLPREKT